MDKQQDSSAKRPRSPGKEECRTADASEAPPTVAPTAHLTTESPAPFKKCRAIRLEIQQNPTSTSVAEQTPAVAQSTPVADQPQAVLRSPPREQTNRPAVSIQSLLASDGLLHEYLKTLPPGFDVTQAVQQIKAELANIDFAITMTSSQLGADEEASQPEERREGQEARQDNLPTTMEVNQPTEAGSVTEREHTQEVNLTSAKEVDQSTAEAGPAEEARTSPSSRMEEQPQQDTRGANPIEDTPSPVQREGIIEEAQTSSDAETIAANPPTTPSPGREFGTDDVPFAEEGVHFDFAP